MMLTLALLIISTGRPGVAQLRQTLATLMPSQALPYVKNDVVFAVDHTGMDWRPGFDCSRLRQIKAPRPDPIAVVCSKGASVVPQLAALLSDSSLTALETGDDVAWFEIEDRYDATYPGQGLFGPSSDLAHEKSLSFNRRRLSVGDLAYYLIGQIVNRKFDSLDALGRGSSHFNGPSIDPTLIEKTKSEWSATSRATLKRSLIHDLARPLVAWRDVGAFRRLQAFFPGTYLGKLIIRRLSVPIKEVSDAEAIAPIGIPVLRYPDVMIPKQYWMLLKAIADYRDPRIDQAVAARLSRIGHLAKLDRSFQDLTVGMMARLMHMNPKKYRLVCVDFCRKHRTSGDVYGAVLNEVRKQ